MRRIFGLGVALALGWTVSATAQTRPGTPTTGGIVPKSPTPAPPGTPTTGGTAPGITPTAPRGTPTTGGTAPGITPTGPVGTPTTGGTAPGGFPTAPRGTPTTGGFAPGTTPTTGGTAPGMTVPGTPTTTPAANPGASAQTGARTGTIPSVQPQPSAALFQQADIARALGLSDRQSADLNRVNQGLQTRYADAVQTLSRLPAADQAAARQQLDRQYRLDFVAGARDVLGPWQLLRYEQLQDQSGGFGGSADPNLRRRVGLTDAQDRDLRSSIDLGNTQIQGVTATDRVRAMQPYADSQRAFQDRFNRFLTPDQQRSWAILVGDAYPLQPFFLTGPAGGAAAAPKP
jgi:hypothetical protein